MKYLLTFYILIFCIEKSNAQEYPFFQQLAFNFYTEKILKEFPVKERFRISKSTLEMTLGVSDCLKKSIPIKIDSIHQIDFLKYIGNFDSNRFELNLEDIDEKQFKIKRKLRGVFPKLLVIFPKTYKDRIFVIIHEEWELKGTRYTIEFDDSGNIIDWCRIAYETVTVH